MTDSAKSSGNNRSGSALQRTRITYLEKPDYSKPLLEIPPDVRVQIEKRLIFLYGDTIAHDSMPELERILKVHYAHKPPEMIDLEKDFNAEERFTEKDIIMITYGDLFLSEQRSPLASLARFLERPRLKGVINTIHVLPFFPYSSDRGFSITSYKTVDPKLGSWQDIGEIGKNFDLMFDGVLNHASAQTWQFQEVLNGHPFWKDMVISFSSRDELDPGQLKAIRRPRTSDVLTEFQSINGPLHVWTTFSPDQIDLNYKNPAVLLGAIETLLLYVRRGADMIRLDAVTYLWAELGTTCASLEQTHEVIKLFRDVLRVVAPRVALITETNVPHEENVSYFGNGHDEAQMVYNFALPPLVLHTFYMEDATALSEWARDLVYPSKTTTFLNMLDTHDGVGVQGVKGILPGEAVEAMIKRAKEHGAFVSYKSGEDGSEQPYEINTTWFGALNREDSGEDLELQVRRFVASRSIALVLRGVPGIYLHGMIGTGNDPEVVEKSGIKRDINRTVVYEASIDEALKDPQSKLSRIRRYLGRIGDVRVHQRSFHPNGNQKILMITPDIFSVLRMSPGGDERILSLINVTNRPAGIDVPVSELGTGEREWFDLIHDAEYRVENGMITATLNPYDVVWLKPGGAHN